MDDTTHYAGRAKAIRESVMYAARRIAGDQRVTPEIIQSAVGIVAPDYVDYSIIEDAAGDADFVVTCIDDRIH